VSGGEWFQVTPKPDTSQDGSYFWFGKFTLQENNVTKYHAWMSTNNTKHKNSNINKSIEFYNDTRLLLLDSAQCDGIDAWPQTIHVKPAILHLLGKKLQFDMTLQNVGSNLLGTLYLVSPPPSRYNRMNYCDTNKKDYAGKKTNIPGYCTEIDIFEGNHYGATSTLHVCKKGAKNKCAPDDTLPSSDPNSFDLSKNNMYPGQGCGHAAGCQTKSGGADIGWFSVDNIKNDNINPNEKFTVIAEFPERGGMKVTLKQDTVSKILHDTTGCYEGGQCQLKPQSPDYEPKNWNGTLMFPNKDTLQEMADIMKDGMYLYTSLWNSSSDFSWVTNIQDGERGNNKIEDAAVTIENMSIEDL
jgi:hypothetical protein